MDTYRKPGTVDRGEPAGFPEVPPVQARVVQAFDTDVAWFDAEAKGRQRRVRAAWWTVAIVVAFVAAVALVLVTR